MTLIIKEGIGRELLEALADLGWMPDGHVLLRLQWTLQESLAERERNGQVRKEVQ